MKKIFAMLLALTMLFALTACGGTQKQEESTSADAKEDGTVDGGWSIYEGDAAVLPEEVQTAFDKACETMTGSTLIPVAFTGQQVVSGMNYMVLCRVIPSVEELKEDAGTYQMVVIYADLSGNAEITKMTEFELTDYTEGEGTDPAAEKTAGGWTVPDQAGAALPKDAQAAFEKAVKDFTGNDLTPLALLGTQPVAGTNYAILCRSSLVTKDPVSSIQIVTVYEDPEGNAEITNIYTLDLSLFNQ